MPTMEEEYAKYQGENYDAINSMYDAQKQSTLSGLEEAYNRNLSNAEAARDQQGKQYRARANDLAVQYERNRRNLNQQAAANGLNTGAGSQMHLALGSNYQRDYGNIRTAEQQALDEANRGIEDLKAAYQSSVQQAIADNDYKRAQALLAEYQNQYAKQLQQAQTLASYGDFSAYLNIPGYTQQQVDAMRNSWIAQNPDMAYRTGAISADDYYRMTGGYPAGYQRTGGGGNRQASGGQTGDLNGDGVVDDTDKALSFLAGWDPLASRRNKGENGGNGGTGPNIENAIYQIGTSRDPQADMEALLNSPYYDQMTEDQRARLATAFQHATHTGPYAPRTQQAQASPAGQIAGNPNWFYDQLVNQVMNTPYTPRIGQAGYYVDPSLRTGPGVPRPNTQYDR